VGIRTGGQKKNDLNSPCSCNETLSNESSATHWQKACKGMELETIIGSPPDVVEPVTIQVANAKSHQNRRKVRVRTEFVSFIC
jgi:hypothetical protein